MSKEYQTIEAETSALAVGAGLQVMEQLMAAEVGGRGCCRCCICTGGRAEL